MTSFPASPAAGDRVVGGGDLVVHGGEVLTPEGRQHADLVIAGGWIAELRPRSGPAEEQGSDRTLDAAGLVVVPGFVDLQCNGGAGIDLTAEPERLWELAAVLPRWGVTAWLPTIVTSPEDIRRRALEVIAAEPPPGSGVRATPLGLHLEGPFLAGDRRGAHAAAHLREPDPALVAGWTRKAGVALVTLAPELPGALDLVPLLAAEGVVVALGHSSATAAQATAAVDLGARAVTHLFSAMAPLHHRAPGLVGAALTDERLTVGLIADGIHVDPVVVDLATRALGSRLALVTDAVAALGGPPVTSAPPGRPGVPVQLGDVEAIAHDGAVRLSDGTLAGSLLSLDRAVANLMAFAGVGLERAVAAAATTPARLLGLADERGVIRPGAAGDVVLLDVTAAGPEVVATVVAGQVAFDRRVAAP